MSGPTILVAMAGLPGSGKSFVAEALAERSGFFLCSVDPAENAMLAAGVSAEQPTGLAAYLVVEALAEANLRQRRSVIVDAVNDHPLARQQWTELSTRTGAELRWIECFCSEPEQKRRLAARRRGFSRLPEPDWESLPPRALALSRWQQERLRLNTEQPLEQLLTSAAKYLALDR